MKEKISAGKSSLMTALILGALTVTALPVFAKSAAADTENLGRFDLDTVVVTATRTEKQLIDTPANAQVITKEQLTEQGYNSLYEAVTSTAQAGIMGWQEDGSDYSGMLTRIRLRGMDNGTLVLIDGHPANFLNASGLNNVPIDSVERIEIVKGAGSVLYGPQAMGGVINVITKKPAAGEKTTAKVSGTIGNRYRDYGLMVNSDIITVGGKKSFTKDFPDLLRPMQGGGPLLEIRDKKQDQLFGSVKLAKDLTFLAAHRKNSNRWVGGNFVNGERKITKDHKSDATYNVYSLNYDSADTGWKAGLAYNDIKMIQTYLFGGTNSLYKGHNINFDVQKQIKINNKDTLVLGGQIEREYWKSVLPSSNTDTDSERTSYSLFQSYDHRFSDKYNMIFGLREYWMGSSRYLASERQLLPQVQGVYKMNDQSSVYFNVGKSFEMPQLSSNFYTGPKYAINPNLKPQSSWSYELGYKYDNDKTFFSATVFYVDATDKILWGKTDDGKNVQVNADKWHNYGIELNVNRKLNDYQRVYFGATVQNPRTKSEMGDYKTRPGEWSQDEAKVLFNLGTTYHKSKFTADTHITAIMKREPSYYLSNGKSASAKAGNPPDHNLKNKFDWSMTLTYTPTDKDTIRLVGHNLLNRKDMINYDEYYATPANFYVTYERSF